MFLGTYRTQFSGKNRIVLPKKFRVEITTDREIILTRGIDGGVWGFKRDDWEKESKAQMEIPLTDEKGRYLRRFIFSGTEIVEFDNQGRFIIPGFLSEFANLKNEVVLIGAGDHFEIWNPISWDKLMS